jgi:hypothetical protein
MVTIFLRQSRRFTAFSRSRDCSSSMTVPSARKKVCAELVRAKSQGFCALALFGSFCCTPLFLCYFVSESQGCPSKALLRFPQCRVRVKLKMTLRHPGRCSGRKTANRTLLRIFMELCRQGHVGSCCEPDFGVEVRRLRCLKNGAQEQNHHDLVLVQLHFFASARIHFGLMGLGGLGIVLLLMPTRRQIDAALPNACPFG